MDVFGHSVLATEVESSTVVTLPTQWAAYATLSRITLYAAVRGITAISFMLTGNGRVTAQTLFRRKMIIRNGEFCRLFKIHY